MDFIQKVSESGEEVKGVSIAQLGQERREVIFNPGETKTIKQMIEEGALPTGSDVSFLVNMQPATSESVIQNGDNIAVVKAIVAG